MNKAFFIKTKLEEESHSNFGKKWSDEEEKLLLEELNKNIDIDSIAKIHKRTIGGINSRLREIAYNLYNDNLSINEIICKTKLEENVILDTIKRRQKSKNISLEKISVLELKSDIKDLKNDVIELKNAIKELVKMMKTAYEI